MTLDIAAAASIPGTSKSVLTGLPFLRKALVQPLNIPMTSGIDNSKKKRETLGGKGGET